MLKPAITKSFFISLTAAFVAVLLISIPASAGKGKAFEGELVDLACYLSAGDKATGVRHKQCGLKCVQEGHQPMGLVTKDGELYVITINHEDASIFSTLASKVNSQVKITGVTHEQKGVKGIEVLKVAEADEKSGGESSY